MALTSSSLSSFVILALFHTLLSIPAYAQDNSQCIRVGYHTCCPDFLPNGTVPTQTTVRTTTRTTPTTSTTTRKSTTTKITTTTTSPSSLGSLQEEFLDVHNRLRRQEGASDMIEMKWDANLEKMAQDSADLCRFEHSSDDYRSDVYGYQYVGENIYYTTGTFNATSAIQMFYDEKANYNYGSNTCAANRVCGHYTQVVWAKSCNLGCAIKTCGRNSYLFCNYGPGGNFNNQKPFKTGSPCSACAGGSSSCNDGLCESQCSGNLW